MLYICTIEAGIIGESALGRINVGGVFSGFNELSCFNQPLGGNIEPHSGAGSIFEYPAKLGFAEIKLAADVIQTDGVCQMFVDEPDHAVFRCSGG